MYQNALLHFQKVDPVLFKAAQGITMDEIAPADPKDYFSHLAESIVSQQLSIKVADVIWNRVINLFPIRVITPQGVLKLDSQDLRGCGLSNAKVCYIKDLAKRTAAGDIKFDRFSNFTPEEITKELVKVKGIGPWTAEMFLIFTIGHPDVFSPGDQGLKNAIAKIPGLKNPNAWSPFRSYACRILWKTLS